MRFAFTKTIGIKNEYIEAGLCGKLGMAISQPKPLCGFTQDERGRDFPARVPPNDLSAYPTNLVTGRHRADETHTFPTAICSICGAIPKALRSARRKAWDSMDSFRMEKSYNV